MSDISMVGRLNADLSLWVIEAKVFVGLFSLFLGVVVCPGVAAFFICSAIKKWWQCRANKDTKP